jgi:hypothetical protein
MTSVPRVPGTVPGTPAPTVTCAPPALLRGGTGHAPGATASVGQRAERDSTEARAASAPAPDLPSPSAAPELPPSTPGPSDARDASAGRVVAVELPLTLRSLGNRREHWRARARRTQREHAAVLGALAGLEAPSLPVVVELTRVGWNTLDVDGLVASVKGPIDALAQWVGVDDRDRRLHWHLAQAITRETRMVRHARTLRSEVAALLRIVVRPWQPSDGSDPLRVLAAAPPASGVP